MTNVLLDMGDGTSEDEVRYIKELKSIEKQLKALAKRRAPQKQ